MTIPDFLTIQAFDGIEDTQSRVVPSMLSSGEEGYGVILVDTDAHESIGGMRIYKKLAPAVEYAKSLVA